MPVSFSGDWSGIQTHTPEQIRASIQVFSSFGDARIIKNKSSDYVLPAILMFITRYGVANFGCVLTDRGREFVNHNLESAFKILNVVHLKGSVWNSRSDSRKENRWL